MTSSDLIVSQPEGSQDESENKKFFNIQRYVYFVRLYSNLSSDYSKMVHIIRRYIPLFSRVTTYIRRDDLLEVQNSSDSTGPGADL